MTISSSALFHFTDRIGNLEDILKNEFHPNYSLENYEDLFSIPNLQEEQAIPMVSFCDLPLSQVGEHLEFYGNYGIGLSKEWGIRNGINPVMYLQAKSHLAGHINDLLDSIFKRKDAETGVRLFQIMSFIKSYKGKLFRRGKYSEEKVFYNEREWRYVPSLSDFPEEKYFEYFTLSKESFLDEKELQKANAEFCNKIKLSFMPRDIKYIIVPKEDEILPTVKTIENIKGETHTYDSLKILSTRIITVEQIKEDF